MLPQATAPKLEKHLESSSIRADRFVKVHDREPVRL